jgi:predicted Fe-Mo cluster-binding NifX family protein
MKVCFPVMENQGLESAVYGHFGSAPGFVVVDIITSEVTSINNSDRIHQHGACNPVAGLGGHQVDAVVVGGIGGGALNKLNSAGMRVFQAQEGTVGVNLELLRSNALREFLPGHSCGGHGHSHGCSH